LTTCSRADSGAWLNYTFLTRKERDIETGLDYFGARYYSSTQGRFTSPDEFTGGPRELFAFADSAAANPTFYSDLTNPQSLNKYQYAYNNPLRYIDPDGHDVIGYTLLISAPNQVPKTDKREVSDVSTLGFKDEARGGYALFNLQVDFDKGDNISDYQHVRASVILGSPYGGSGTVRNAQDENPSGSQTSVNGQSRFVSDNPGTTARSGDPKASLQGSAYAAIFAAGEYNKKTGQLSQNVAYYGVKIVYGKEGKIDQSKSVVTRITRDEFIDLAKKAGANLPKDKDKKRCPECLLSPPN
jgi:RHS repeat-associated protein